MKSFLVVICMIAGAISAGSYTSKAQQGAVVSFSVFYDELSPYGAWVEDPVHGYVWVPDMGTGFHPYHTNGHWVLTEYGNTWVSFYDWGWAPFHYGRWMYDAFYGWVWVPGYEWGPAWVYWRYGGGYYGWAPLSPGYAVTVSFGAYNCPMDWWMFIPHNHLYRRNITHYVRDRRQNINIYNQTTVINNTYINRTRNTTYITGPTRENYRQVSGRDVTVHRVNDVATRQPTTTRDNTVNIYRPEIDKTRGAVPANVIRSTQPLREPAPVNTNENRQAPFYNEIEKTRPARQAPQPAPQRTEPVQRVPQPGEPVRQTPQRTEPVQRVPQPGEPVRQTPQRTEPVQRTPKRSEPVRQTPQRTEPVQRTPQRSEPARQTPQRTEPAQRAPERAQPVKRDR